MKTKHRIKKTKNYHLLIVIIAVVNIWGCETSDHVNHFSGKTETDISDDANARHDSEIFSQVDVPPVPEDGIASFISYICKNLKYPEDAKKQGIQGKVFIRFVVTKDGWIKNVEVEKGIGYGMDEEAMRVITSYDKKWNPGINKGEPVNTKMVLPITYTLQDQSID